MREENAKQAKLKRILWIVYIVGISFIGFLFFVRLVSLCRRMEWRNDLDGKFPSDCGDWAKKCGCTRIALKSDECVRAGDITTENAIVFDVGANNDRMLNNRLAHCAKMHHSSKLMSPRDLADSTESGQLIHITWTSAVFGFLDDMYVISEVDPNDSDKRIVSV